MPITNDHLNPTNELFSKFIFEKKVKSAIAFLYFNKTGVAQKLLHEVKYHRKSDLAVELGLWYANTLENFDVDYVLPVPLHKSKLRQRTFNQSTKIAEGIVRNFGWKIKEDLIERSKKTQTQTRKNQTERWINMENVYSTASEDLEGKSVLIIDDIITTGATVGMLCQRLAEANVKEIHILCIARGN